jgi:hypothetical protein
VARRTTLLVDGLEYIRRVVGRGFDPLERPFAGLGRQNRPDQPAGARIWADLGTAFSDALLVQLGVVVGTVRAAAKMGFLAISAIPPIAGDRRVGKPSGLCRALLPGSRGAVACARAARGPRSYNYIS